VIHARQLKLHLQTLLCAGFVIGASYSWVDQRLSHNSHGKDAQADQRASSTLSHSAVCKGYKPDWKKGCMACMYRPGVQPCLHHNEWPNTCLAMCAVDCWWWTLAAHLWHALRVHCLL